METWLATRLLTGTLHGACVISLVWLVCRCCPRIPAPVQAALWWLASLKLLVVFLPLPAVALPFLPAPAAVALAVSETMPVPEAPLWITVIVSGWAIGVLGQAWLLVTAFRRMRAVVARATPAPDAVRAAASELARAVGLRRCPELRVSDEIAGPLVSGVRRPMVLLPSWLSPADARAAIGHELVHVRRHDLALGWVPALAERLFFFHPLARLAAREYVTAREAACDAGVLRALNVSAGDYARLLVTLGVAQAGPLPAAGGAPASRSSLRRRLEMLQCSPVHGRNRHVSWSLAVVVLLACVPFELSARQPAVVLPVAAPPVEQREVPADFSKEIESARRQMEADAEAYEKAVAAYELAEQSARAAQANEAERRDRERRAVAARRRTEREILAAQQEDLRRYIRETQESLRTLAEQQKQLAETLKALTLETERIGNAVPRK